MKYFLFDFDGTLVDTTLGVINSVKYAFDKMGIKHALTDDELAVRFIGPPLTQSFPEFVGDDRDRVKEAIDTFRVRYRTLGVLENELYPYLVDCLDSMKNYGCKLYIASSKPKTFICEILKQRGLDCYFEGIYAPGFDEDKMSKYDVIMAAIAKITESDKAAKIYMIGDRKFDIEGAHKAHIPAIGVRWGSAGKNELKEAGSDYIVSDYRELEVLAKDL